jgi:hypothetical protein
MHIGKHRCAPEVSCGEMTGKQTGKDDAAAAAQYRSKEVAAAAAQ